MGQPFDMSLFLVCPPVKAAMQTHPSRAEMIKRKVPLVFWRTGAANRLPRHIALASSYC